METVQIARRLGASLAISIDSTTEKAERARAEAYEHVIDLSKESLKDAVLRITGGKGVDMAVRERPTQVWQCAMIGLRRGERVRILGLPSGVRWSDN